MPLQPTRLSHELHRPGMRDQFLLGRGRGQAGQFKHSVEAPLGRRPTRERFEACRLRTPVDMTSGQRAARGGVAADLLFAGQRGGWGGLVVEASGQQEQCDDEGAHVRAYAQPRPLIHAGSR